MNLVLFSTRIILDLQSRDKTRSELRLQWHPWVQRFLANEVSVDSTEALYFLLSPLVSPCFTHDAMAFPVLVLVKSAVFFVGSKLARHSYRSPVSDRWGSPFFQTPRYLRLLIKPYQTNHQFLWYQLILSVIYVHWVLQIVKSWYNLATVVASLFLHMPDVWPNSHGLKSHGQALTAYKNTPSQALDAKKRRLERAAEELWLGLARFLASAWGKWGKWGKIYPMVHGIHGNFNGEKWW